MSDSLRLDWDVNGLLRLAVGSGRVEMLHAVARKVLAGQTLSPEHQAELLIILAERMLAPLRADSNAARRRRARAEEVVRTGK